MERAVSKHSWVPSLFKWSMDNMLSAHEGIDDERKANYSCNTFWQRHSMMFIKRKLDCLCSLDLIPMQFTIWENQWCLQRWWLAVSVDAHFIEYYRVPLCFVASFKTLQAFLLHYIFLFFIPIPSPRNSFQYHK